MARRLDTVRRESGCESLRAFWKRLTEGNAARSEFSISYEALRWYHYDREAPVSYLERVADVFGYRFEWLALGRGPRTTAEAPIDAPPAQLQQGLERELDLADFLPGTRALFDDAWRQLINGFRDDKSTMTQSDSFGIGLQLLDIIQLPLHRPGYRHRGMREVTAHGVEEDRAFPTAELNAYYRAMLSALMLAIPAPSTGDFLAEDSHFTLEGWKESPRKTRAARAPGKARKRKRSS